MRLTQSELIMSRNGSRHFVKEINFSHPVFGRRVHFLSIVHCTYILLRSERDKVLFQIMFSFQMHKNLQSGEHFFSSFEKVKLSQNLNFEYKYMKYFFFKNSNHLLKL